jgi:hypothetical protein
MYKFRILEAHYDIDIALTYPDYTQEHYHCSEHVIVRYRKDPNCYLFEMTGRKDIQINNKAPEEIMDKLMVELGDALYPLDIKVSPAGEILEVNYFEEVQDRWNKKAGELLEKYNTSPFAKYLQISARNMKQEIAFRKSLLKNTFFKCYFLPDNVESFLFEVHHFPQRSANTLFLFELDNDGILVDAGQFFSARTIFPTEKKASGQLSRAFTELGDLDFLYGELNWEDAEGLPYKKTITIRTDKDKRDYLKSSKFWSFILD